MKDLTTSFILFVLAVLILTPTFSPAQIPRTISYQGVLTNEAGDPLPDGNISITFKLYDVAENGEALWEETQDTELSSGLLNVTLGAGAELNLPFDKPYWLGIAIGEEDELSPRTALTAAPYSLNSGAVVLEPEAGQSFIIRDENGNVVHTLSTNGNSEHAGTATFDGGIQIKFGADSSIVMQQNGSYLLFGPDITPAQTDKEGTEAISTSHIIPRTRLRVTDIATPQLTSNRVASESDGGVTAVEGKNIEFGNGVEGVSKDGNGVSGEGTGSGRGLSAISRGTGEAIIATAHGTGDAIVGTALSSGAGVTGFSSNSNGGHFTSQNGIGLFAKGAEKAAVFDGDVDVKGKLKIENVEADPAQERILVWSSDMIVRYRTLPSAVGDEDWLIDSETGAITTGFDVIIKDSAGKVTTRFDKDGTSLHTGVETFENDVILKGADGKGIKLVDAEGNTIAGFGREDLDTGQRIGVFGKAENAGDLAGVFEGDVDVLGEIVASSLHIVNTSGDSLIDFFADGTSRHRGVESYEAGIKVLNSDGSEAVSIMPNADPNTEYTIKVKGNLEIDGLLQATSKDFKIDHPLDPENKYLRHTSIESDDMKNVYDGKVTLDDNGEAHVQLPEWFQALNIDYRYQLTCVGGYAPVYIAQEITNNSFQISGGSQGLKVCWQVTGIRNDKWAQENRLPIEMDKN